MHAVRQVSTFLLSLSLFWPLTPPHTCPCVRFCYKEGIKRKGRETERCKVRLLSKSALSIIILFCFFFCFIIWVKTVFKKRKEKRVFLPFCKEVFGAPGGDRSFLWWDCIVHRHHVVVPPPTHMHIGKDVCFTCLMCVWESLQGQYTVFAYKRTQW